MKTQALLIIVLFAISSCDFSKSVNKDLITGLSTKGDGLSCEKVYLSDGENKISTNEFIYGEKFYINFGDIQGFEKEDATVFPGMKLMVLSEEKDTVLLDNDLYKEKVEGFNLSPLLLRSSLIVAKPIHSNKEYSVLLKIWDKKGNGTFKAQMDFKVVPNDKLKIESTNLSYSEIYLYSKVNDNIITDNMVNLNETVYLLFEGLDGFNLEDGKVFFGMSINAKDNKGNELIKADDLFEDTGYEYAELKKMLSADLMFPGDSINNPVSCEFVVWDKKGDNKIRVSTELNLN